MAATAGVMLLRRLAPGGRRHNESGRSKEGGLRCGGRISEDTSVQLFLAGDVQFLCVWGVANKREGGKYNPVYDLRSKNTTKHSLRVGWRSHGIFKNY